MLRRVMFLLILTTFPACSLLLGLPKSGTYAVPMRDGTKLATDVYLPDSLHGRVPTILIRTTYNKSAEAKGVKTMALIAKRFTNHGYAVVVQDTRGRFASAGIDSIFRTDGRGPNEDGYDTIDWIIRQRWSNGKVGMWGMSALGITSYLAAASGNPALKCAYIVAAGSNLYSDVFYPGGVYRENLVNRWVTGQKRADYLPYIYAHADYGPYWDAMNLRAHAGDVHAAIYQWGGWFDVMSQGQTDGFAALEEHGGEGAKGHQMLIMGPWSHGSMGKQGQMRFPKNSTAVNPLGDAMPWFDHYLKGRSTRLDTVPPVRYYLMGDVDDSTAPGNVWRTAEQWPPISTRQVDYYLRDGHLLSTAPPDTDHHTESYRYDPHDPVPTQGGQNLYPPIGPADMRQVEARQDVISFSTEPLTEPVAIAGKVRVRLYASSSARDTDFMGMLCDVYPDGRSMLILDGAIKARHRNSLVHEEFMTPGTVYEFDIDLWDTAIAFNRGHRIRLDITSSNAPRFQPNPNTATPFHTDTVGVVATNTIYHDRMHQSCLQLPVLPLDK